MSAVKERASGLVLNDVGTGVRPSFGPSGCWAPHSRGPDWSQATVMPTVHFNWYRRHHHALDKWHLREDLARPLQVQGPMAPGSYRLYPAVPMDLTKVESDEFRLVQAITRVGIVVTGPTVSWDSRSPDLIPAIKGPWLIHEAEMNAIPWLYQKEDA